MGYLFCGIGGTAEEMLCLDVMVMVMECALLCAVEVTVELGRVGVMHLRRCERLNIV